MKIIVHLLDEMTSPQIHSTHILFKKLSLEHPFWLLGVDGTLISNQSLKTPKHLLVDQINHQSMAIDTCS